MIEFIKLKMDTTGESERFIYVRKSAIISASPLEAKNRRWVNIVLTDEISYWVYASDELRELIGLDPEPTA